MSLARYKNGRRVLVPKCQREARALSRSLLRPYLACKEFKFCSKCHGKPLEDFNQRSDKI